MTLVHPPVAPPDGDRLAVRSVGVLSTYPPTPCGLATFSAALGHGLATHGVDVRVVRVVEDGSVRAGPVVGELVNGSPSSVAGAADLLNECDAVIVQHEYGLYGGDDGDEVVQVLRTLRVPSIVVAHTVLTAPTDHQRSVLVDVASAACRVVVMSEAAGSRLCRRFGVDPAKVVTIPHGATVPVPPPPTPIGSRPVILTAGLLGPGKGVERVIGAMSTLQRLPQRPRYLVAGQTHPKVLAAQGEAYRQSLIEQAWRSGVAASVDFDSEYRDVAALTALLQSAAVVVLPYDSDDQVTSGVLVDAVAAGRPVVATAFPHAVELLASGAGMVVDHDDHHGLASALHGVLTDPGLALQMAAEAQRIAPSLAWPVVAGAYMDVARGLVAERAARV